MTTCSRLDDAIARMLDVIDPPDDAAMEVEVALRLGACRQGGVEVEDVARRVGRSRDSVTKYLHRRGLPSPGRLLTWGRLLDAMSSWTDGRNLDDVACPRGFAQGAVLSGMLHHHTGMYATEWSRDIGELCEALYETWAAKRRAA